MGKRALITGITGQDGTYLAELLISKGYSVFGLVRGQNNPRKLGIQRLIPKLEFVDGDLADQSSLISAIQTTEPDEVYNLGAISFVAMSFKQSLLTGDITGLGPLRVLEAIRIVNPKIRFYQASSSEMFGKVHETPQTELTPFHPRSPYGVAKVYGHFITMNYRESYDMFASSGILFNHESPRRGLEFVTRKITNAVARIKLGQLDTVALGNLESKRDWGYAKDYVEAMYAMLQQDAPEDFVIATGETHSIREFLQLAFGHVDMEWEQYVTEDPRFMRPAEVDLLKGDATKARKELNWTPSVTFPELVSMMVDNDLELVEQELAAGTTATGHYTSHPL